MTIKAIEVFDLDGGKHGTFEITKTHEKNKPTNRAIEGGFY